MRSMTYICHRSQFITQQKSEPHLRLAFRVLQEAKFKVNFKLDPQIYSSPAFNQGVKHGVYEQISVSLKYKAISRAEASGPSDA